jgi:hypothetical protein
VSIAVLIPGHGYTTERPLLHFAAAVFRAHGWETHEVRWPEPPPARDGQELTAWFDQLRAFTIAQVTPILDRMTAPRIALAGKSMGAFAAALAADRGLPGIWLTPVLPDSPLPADLRRATAPFLLAGATVDRSWDPVIARSFGAPVYEAEGADHGMEIDGDPVRSAGILREVTIAMDEFVGEL